MSSQGQQGQPREQPHIFPQETPQSWQYEDTGTPGVLLGEQRSPWPAPPGYSVQVGIVQPVKSPGGNGSGTVARRPWTQAPWVQIPPHAY